MVCLNIFSFLIKTKTGEDPNDYLPIASVYDPSVDYDALAWNIYYETHKGEEFAESAKKIIDSYRYRYDDQPKDKSEMHEDQTKDKSEMHEDQPKDKSKMHDDQPKDFENFDIGKKFEIELVFFFI